MACTVPLTPEQLAALKAQIAEAEAAYHSLMLGTMARVIVDKNGERVEFAAGRKGDLYLYIQHLKSQLPLEVAICTPAYGPARFLF